MVILILGWFSGHGWSGFGADEREIKETEWAERLNGQRKDLVCYCVLCVFKFEFVFGFGFVLLCSCVDV